MGLNVGSVSIQERSVYGRDHEMSSCSVGLRRNRQERRISLCGSQFFLSESKVLLSLQVYFQRPGKSKLHVNSISRGQIADID